MAHLIIENLLSTSVNRPLYEALWFLSITKNGRPEKSNFNFENVSVVAVCNELMAQIKDGEVDSRKFFLSTQLVFGTLQLYRIQIDKLFNQTKLALQSYNSSPLFNKNWISDMTQKASKQKKSVQKQTTATQKSVKKQKVVKEEIQKSFLDDFDLIEDFFNIPDDDKKHCRRTSTTIKGKKARKNSVEDDSGFDKTMATHAITIIEETTLCTSGFNTLITFDDENEFGDSNQFQDLFKDTEETTDLNKIQQEEKLVRRRLTYDQVENVSIDVLRVNDVQPLINDVSIHPYNLYDASTFDLNANDKEVVPQIQEIEIPSIPVAIDDAIPKSSEITENLTAELQLEELQEPSAKRRCLKKIRSLVIDKQTMLSDCVVYKNFDTYVEKLTEVTPFKNFNSRMFRLKSCAEKLFNSTSLRLENSPLVLIYQRNMKKVPQRLMNKKRSLESAEDDQENKQQVKKARKMPNRSARNSILKSSNNINIQEIIDDESLMPPPPLPHQSATSTQHNVIDMEIELPLNQIEIPLNQPQVENNSEQCDENLPAAKKSKKNGKRRVVISVEKEGLEENNKFVLRKLKNLWQQNNESITMDKLCRGLNRFEAARIFFDLLVLSKTCVIELQENDSLHITNILCKISMKELTQLCS